MTADRDSLFGFRLAPAASRTAPAAASALSAKVGGPEPTPLAFRSAPLLSQADRQGA